MTDPLDDLVSPRVEPSSDPESARIYPLIAESGNQRVLKEWLAGHDSHRAVDTAEPITEAQFDLCIVDQGGLKQHKEQLEAVKSAAEPVLLPVLLLLPETRTDVINADGGAIADNVFATTIDEIVSLPIRQTELEWRIRALLRLRIQSLNIQRRTNTLQLFRQAVEESGYAVYITGPDRIIKYVNPAFEEITGYSSAEAIGQTPKMLNSGEMSEAYFDALWETLLDGNIWRNDVVDRRKNGELYYAFQTIAPIIEDGDIKAFVAIQADITERKEREETLERRTQAIENAPIGISISDPDQPDNPLVYVNEAFEELTGYSREEAIGRNCRFLQGEGTDPDQVAKIREAIDAKEPVSVVIRNYRKDGSEFWNQFATAPVWDEAGDVVSYVGFQQDVTERKQREQQLKILGRILRHNLRNEMNVIRGWAETIKSQRPDESSVGTDKIIAKSEDLTELAEKEKAITDVLTEPPRTVEITLAELLGHVRQPVSEEFPDARITIDCPEGVTAAVSNRFEQALEELVWNAATHNDSSEPEITISVTEKNEGVKLTIQDNGPAIPAMERNVLLGNVDQTSTYHGSGLGLWLVNLIVSRSGATVSHETAEPRGNIIEISLAKET